MDSMPVIVIGERAPEAVQKMIDLGLLKPKPSRRRRKKRMGEITVLYSQQGSTNNTTNNRKK